MFKVNWKLVRGSGTWNVVDKFNSSVDVDGKYCGNIPSVQLTG